MLKKLYYSDLKRQSKVLSLVCAVLIAYTAVSLLIPHNSQSIIIVLLISAVFTYLVSLVFQIYLIIDYYKTMYSDQGVLTNMLPIGTGNVVFTKCMALFSSMLVFSLIQFILTSIISYTLLQSLNALGEADYELIYSIISFYTLPNLPLWFIFASLVQIVCQSFFVAAFVVCIVSLANLPVFKRFMIVALIAFAVLFSIVTVFLIVLGYQIPFGISQEIIYDEKSMPLAYGDIRLTRDLSYWGIINNSNESSIPETLTFPFVPYAIMFIFSIILLTASIYTAAHKLRLK